MAITPKDLKRTEIIYPESDGKPLSDNTKQLRWILTLVGGLDALFKDDPQVFVAGDILWYPVEGNNVIRIAPDAMVVFGRPKGDRGSYLQWREENIAPQVVFEVLSPGNTKSEMRKKLAFYEQYGVDEYYVYDPDRLKIEGYLRDGANLKPVAQMNGWVSPRLQIRFELDRQIDDDLRVYLPDGQPLRTYTQLSQLKDEIAERAEQERIRAEQGRQRAEEEHAKYEKLLAQLRALGHEPEA